MEVKALSEHRYEGTWKLPDIEREQEGILFIENTYKKRYNNLS